MRWLLLLIPGICLAQSVPNTPPPISSGLIWTPAQWTNAWQNKTDYPAPCSAMPAFSGAMISSAGSCVTAFGPTLNAQFVNGFYNPCYGRTYCEDTFRNLESITCTQSGSSVIVALAESLPSSYANTGAYGVFGGCGPLGALNVRGGITATGGNGNYLPGDFATVTGGTPTYSVSLSGSSIAGASGILTVGSASGTILLGMVVTGGTTAPVTFITNFITGTGGAGTYQTNASSGSTPTTATSIAVFEVMQTSPFAAAVVAAGFYSTQPGTTQAATTSAAGSGATFSPGWGNWPLYGPVTGTGVGTVTISGFCTSCGPAGTNWIAIGHDDVPGIANGMTTYGVAGIFLPPSQAPAWAAGHALQWGQASQLNLTYTKEFILACNGQSINALEPMNAQLYIAYGTTGGAFGLPSNNEVNDCYLEGMGLVNFNVYLAGANWRLSRNMMRNAQVANINIGDPGGDNAENNTLLSNTLHNDISLEPAGGGYAFYLSHWATQGSSDNQIVNMFGDGCIWSCFSDNSAGLSATTIHMYLGYGGPTYQITAAKFVGTDLIGDNAPPGTATFQLSGGLAILNSWQANTTNATNGQMGVQITADSNISLGCGGIGATAANWAAQKGNILVDTGGGGGKGGSSNDIAFSCISGGFPGWTIAQLPVCNVNAAGLTEFISNGVASPTYNAAVGTTGTSTQSVFCTWNGTTGTWVYR